jgi:hypothetical protein
MVVFDKTADLQDTEQNPIVSDKAPPVKGIRETKIHRLVLEDLEIKRAGIIASPHSVSRRAWINRVAHTEECPLSEHYEISGGPVLAKGVSPKGRGSTV